MKNLTKTTLIGFLAVAFVTSLVAPAPTYALSVHTKTNADVKAKVHFSDDDYDNDHDVEDYKDNDRLPRGIRRAPGVEKRVDDDKGLPFGIFARFFQRHHDDDGEHGSDTDRIVITERDVDTSETEATLLFTTNLETDGTLTYSENADFSDSTKVNLDLSKEHKVVLSNLTADTVYYFQLELSDGSDEYTLETRVQKFHTDGPETDAAIRLHNASIDTTADSATLAFDTNIATEGTLTYSENADLSDGTEVALALSENHEVTLDNLDEDTRYYFMIELASENGETTFESTVRSFHTKGSDTTDPKIMFYHIFNVDSDSAYVIWITSEQTDARVWVEDDADIDTTQDPTVVETEFGAFHVLHVDGLSADTEYFMQVASTDKSDNTTFSNVLSFTTDAE